MQIKKNRVIKMEEDNKEKLLAEGGEIEGPSSHVMEDSSETQPSLDVPLTASPLDVSLPFHLDFP